jgi:hypothetical protein
MKNKTAIINEIEEDFRIAYHSCKLPMEASLVFTLLCLLQKLLTKLKHTSRDRYFCIRVSNYTKAGPLAQSFVTYKFSLIIKVQLK